jgi:copper chaperone CopZ
LKTVTLNFKKIGSKGCANTIFGSLESLVGVDKVEVLLNSNKVKISFEDDIFKLDMIKKAIQDAGYSIKV